MVKTADVDITPFVISHGKRPSGKGHWAFKLLVPGMRRSDIEAADAVWVASPLFPGGAMTFAAACKLLEAPVYDEAFWQLQS